jgi:hypothetical protein
MNSKKKRKDAFWFPHDANAGRDEKMLKLLVVYGYQGYGWFWKIIELMRESNDYKLGLKGRHALKGLADLLRTDDAKLSEFITDCVKEFTDSSGVGLFSTDKETFWSDSFLSRMKRMDDLRKVRRALGSKGGKKRWHLEDKLEAKGLEEASKRNENGVEANAKGLHSKEIARREENRREENRREEKRTRKEKTLHPLTPYSSECQMAFQTWNQQPSLIHHVKMIPIMQKQFDKCWKRNGGDQDAFNLILQGMKNYSAVLSDPSAFFKYKWSFSEFLSRENAMAMFGVSEEDCREKFKGREKKVNGMVDGDKVKIENSSDFFAFQTYLNGVGLKKESYWTSEKTGEKTITMKGEGITKHWRLFLGRGKK